MIVRRLLTVLLAFALLGAAAPHAWTVPGTIRIALAQSPNTLDPILSTMLTESFVATLVFDGLVFTKPDGSIDPRLAARVPTLQNGDISKDGRTITYHLRHGVLWQDGAAFTSADVAFTQSARLNMANNVTTRTPYDRVVHLETPDAFTVVVHLTQPYAPFVAQWNALAILPAHLLAGKHDLNTDAFNAAPVGTGPYIVDRFDRGHQLTYRANQRYFLGKPGAQRLVVRVMPDENSELIALRTHEVDWIFEPSPGAVRNYHPDADTIADQYPVNGHYGIRLNVEHAPLNDLRVRQALSFAIDRAALASKIGAGFVDPATADLPSFLWAYDRSLKPATYDPDRARALLRAAGWTPGSDGILTKDGRPLSLSFVYGAGGTTAGAVAVQIQSMLHAVGIDLDVRTVQANVLFAPAASGGVLSGGLFDLAWSGFFAPDDPDNSRLYSCATRAPHGYNYSRWCDPAFERWTNVALTHYDRKTRTAAYAQVERAILAGVPELFVWWPRDLQLRSVDLHGTTEDDSLSAPYRWTI